MAKKGKKKDEKKEVKKDLGQVELTVSELLAKMGVEGKVEVEQEEENILVNIESTKHKGLLIGTRGETLSSVQTIVNLILKNETGEWHNVLVNVGDWREKQEDYLASLATQTASRAVETGKPQNLYNLTPAQRKIVHMHLAEDEQVESFSEGEGRERYLVVQKKELDGSPAKD